MMRRIVMILVMMIAGGIGHAQGVDNRVDELLERLVERANLPGLAITVKQAGAVVYNGGFGYADVEEQVPMEAHTQVRTASVAKVLTATALGKLVSEGKLDLDAPLQQYVPYLKGPYAALTARQVAGHTAGVIHQPKSQRVKKRNYAEVRASVEFMEEFSLQFEPGTAYQYSTLGYNLLAALIEEVAGKRYVDYMREDIFEPLGMTQTFPEYEPTFSVKDARMYYYKKGKLKRDRKLNNGSYKLAGAGFRSTSVDLVKLMDAYTNGFIKEEVVQELFSSNELADGTKTNVGIGWRLNVDMKGRPTVEHAGSWQGARTVIVYYPAQQLSIAIMVNAKCTLFIEETAHMIAQLFLTKDTYQSNLNPLDVPIVIENNRSDGSVESYTGQLSLSDTQAGKLVMDTALSWLKDNEVIPLIGTQDFALVTSFGLLYLKLTLQPEVEGALFTYQILGDQHHPTKTPMLRFEASSK